jgi:hypothetical protein
MLQKCLIVAPCLAFPILAIPYEQWRFLHDQPLSFMKDGTFQVTVFGDLHYGEGMSDFLTS